MHRGRSTEDRTVEDRDELEQLGRAITPMSGQILALLLSDPTAVTTNAGRLSRLKVAAVLGVAPKVADEVLDELKEALNGLR